MNKQARREYLTVTNDAIAAHICGMTFGEIRDARITWQASKALMPWREWMFCRAEQTILAARDASYNEAREPI